MESVRSLDAYSRRSLRALIIVAHPDDETLFMGGTIAKMRRWRWTILCVTDCDPRYNHRRVSELKRVCALYRACGANISFEAMGMRKRNGILSSFSIRRGLTKYLDSNDSYDIVFTHNRDGEYGHASHKAVHRAVSGVRSKNVFYFSPFKGPCARVELMPDAKRLKRKALSIYYRGSQKTNLTRLSYVVNRCMMADNEYFIAGEI